MTAQFGDLRVEANVAEARRNPRTEWRSSLSFTPHRIPEDLADFLLRAAAMAPGAALELLLDVVVELTNQ